VNADEGDGLSLGDDGTSGKDGDGASQLECPECGQGFATKATLGYHRWREHGVRGSSRRSAAKRKAGGGGESEPRRPREGVSKGRRAQLVSETMRELADLADSLRGRALADSATIADTIRRDADRMGDALAGLAERSIFGFLGPIIDALFGAGGPLSLVTAFGPTVRKTMAARPRREGDDLTALQTEYERIYVEESPAAAAEWAQQQGLEVAGGGG
jgi:hypothetical protein